MCALQCLLPLGHVAADLAEIAFVPSDLWVLMDGTLLLITLLYEIHLHVKMLIY